MELTYATALRLKEAGFPQNPDNPTVHTPKCGGWDNPDPECREESRPRDIELEELIAACEDNVFSINTIWSEGKNSHVVGWYIQRTSAVEAPRYYNTSLKEVFAEHWLYLLENNLITLPS